MLLSLIIPPSLRSHYVHGFISDKFSRASVPTRAGPERRLAAFGAQTGGSAQKSKRIYAAVSAGACLESSQSARNRLAGGRMPCIERDTSWLKTAEAEEGQLGLRRVAGQLHQIRHIQQVQNTAGIASYQPTTTGVSCDVIGRL